MPKRGNKSSPASKKHAQVGSSFSKALTAPVAKNSQFKNRKPTIRYDGNKCHVAHCERFGTCLSSQAFAVTAFVVNPGVEETFPWLAPFARLFEKYKFKKLAFTYRTKTATGSTGDISLAIDYDAADDAPGSTLVMENYDDAVSGSPWQDVTLHCSKLNLGAEVAYYVRDGAPLDANLDVKTYDTGTLFLATEGQFEADKVNGYLYVEYEVELSTQALMFAEATVAGGIIASGGNVTNVAPMGDDPRMSDFSFGFDFDAEDSKLLVWFPGDYALFMTVDGTDLTTASISISEGPLSTLEIFEFGQSTIGSTLLEVILTFRIHPSPRLPYVPPYINFTVAEDAMGTPVATGGSFFLSKMPFGSCEMPVALAGLKKMMSAGKTAAKLSAPAPATTVAAAVPKTAAPASKAPLRANRGRYLRSKRR